MYIYDALVFWQELERKYLVTNWRINGIAVWPLIRLQLGLLTSAYPQHENVDKVAKWKTYSNKIAKVCKDRVNLLAKDSKHQQTQCQADIVFMRDMCDRNIVLPNGTSFDHNIDPLQKRMEQDGYISFNFEYIGRSELRLPRWSNSCTIDFLVLRCLFRKKLFSKIEKINFQMEKYDKFLDELSLRGIEKNFFSLDSISSRILYINDMSNWFIKRLRAIKPRIVILSCWYDDAKMALALAAHRLKIPVVEIQHGIAAGSRCHPSYYDWSKIPDGGYELMPDYMWVWDKDDYDAMNTWARNSMRPFIGGHPMNLIWSNPANELSQYYQKKYEQEYGFDKPTILVTLQWNNIYPQWFINYINEHEEYNWLIRLHPVVDDYEKDFMGKISVKENIKKDTPSSFPLEILLQNVNLHVTLSSSVVLDAAAFGCHSIIMNEDGINKYGNQLECGIAFYADNTREFHERVQTIIGLDTSNKGKRHLEEIHAVGNCAVTKLIDIAKNACPIWEKS